MQESDPWRLKARPQKHSWCDVKPSRGRWCSSTDPNLVFPHKESTRCIMGIHRTETQEKQNRATLNPLHRLHFHHLSLLEKLKSVVSSKSTLKVLWWWSASLTLLIIIIVLTSYDEMSSNDPFTVLHYTANSWHALYFLPLIFMPNTSQYWVFLCCL